jgi:hypothetical protein
MLDLDRDDGARIRRSIANTGVRVAFMEGDLARPLQIAVMDKRSNPRRASG